MGRVAGRVGRDADPNLEGVEVHPPDLGHVHNPAPEHLARGEPEQLARAEPGELLEFDHRGHRPRIRGTTAASAAGSAAPDPLRLPGLRRPRALGPTTVSSSW